MRTSSAYLIGIWHCIRILTCVFCWQVRKMNLISPTGVEVNIGNTLQPGEYIGMCRRDILDQYIRNRAFEFGAECVNSLVTSIDIPAVHKKSESQYIINYQEYQEGSSAGVPKSMKVYLIIGVDGANFLGGKVHGCWTVQFFHGFPRAY